MPSNTISDPSQTEPLKCTSENVVTQKVDPQGNATPKFVSRRGGDRINCTYTVKISHPIFGERIVDSKDVSEEGVFITLQESPIPPVGTLLTFEVLGGLPVQNKKTVKVVRSDVNGIALRFIH